MRVVLTKWYVDVVTDEGRTAIAYWGELDLWGVQARVAGLLASDGGAARGSFTVRAGRAPGGDVDHLAWSTPGLGLAVRAARRGPGVARRLLATPQGAVDWTAWAPAADVRITSGTDTWQGLGYVERLDLTIAPWAVPVDRFRWGRWVSNDRSLVWIAWDGPHPLRLAWLDGSEVPLRTAERDDVQLGTGHLTLSDPVALTDATIGEQLTSLVPLRRVIDRVAHSHQTRWRSRGTLETTDAPAQHGWAIHEVVRWR